ncbi:MAG: UDP-N-acetylglucosamine--N-acetylmuramyl-(pentapeptide) pyrophosphoryl-undecaprenol [Verrucomicrobiota bacterium]|jgi:UDP-N-acetylglucosamine--N-acetylmuramyl-(pentapeptide) pyrophosphoryl-undecaprenol N-acetylglucosamine transferase
MVRATPRPLVAIACGGTGGHLFPGLAVADALRGGGVDVQLFVSSKAVDRLALGGVGREVPVQELEAVGLDGRRPWRFLAGVLAAWGQARCCFRDRRPAAVLAMGGFTSVGPVLEARRLRVPVFLHESNTIPGRATRWLGRWVDEVFVGFPEAALRLGGVRVREVGTPVRREIGELSREGCCRSLGLDAAGSVLVVCGGSQGAVSVNTLVLDALPTLRERVPGLQVVHLTGVADLERVRGCYAGSGVRALVEAFSDRMPEVLGAADLAISRAGASSLAELAAARLPALLVPYPSAADNHQAANAEAFGRAGAASWREQAGLDGAAVADWVSGMLADRAGRESMRLALARRHRPDAAADIAHAILGVVADDVGARRRVSRAGGRDAVSGGANGLGDVRYSEVAVGEGSGGGRL